MNTAIANIYSDDEHDNQPAAMTAAVQSREIAAIQSQMAIAKSFPRSQRQAMDRILVACQRKTLAEKALYSYAKGKTEVTGPSIRLAEAMAREWGNLDFGIREIEQRDGKSTVEAYCLDLETNVRCSKLFQVEHKRDTKQGSYAIKDSREIYELVANVGARRMRACILGIIPGDVVDAAVAQCDETLHKSVELTPERIKKMLEAFEAYQVDRKMIEERIQRSLDSITPAQFLSLMKTYNSLKDGMGTAADYFRVVEVKPQTLTKNKGVGE